MLILSGNGIQNKGASKSNVNKNRQFSGFGATGVSAVTQQAKQLTAQSQQKIATAKKAIDTTKQVSSLLSQSLSKLKSTSLSGFSGFRGYGALTPAQLKAELEKQKKVVNETKQVIAQAKQVVAQTKSMVKK